MTPRKSRAKPTGDPFVPLSGERLNAAAEHKRVTLSWLAEKVGTSQQALSHHALRSSLGHCRQSLRTKLARALAVSEGFLEGAPVVDYWSSFIPDRTEYRYSSKTELAAGGLSEMVTASCVRDCERANCTATETRLATSQVTAGLSHFIEIAAWRKRLMIWTDAKVEARGFTEPPTQDPFSPHPLTKSDENHEKAILGLVAALEHGLTPWFDDEARLNYRAFRDYATPPQLFRKDSDSGAKRASNPRAALPKSKVRKQ